MNSLPVRPKGENVKNDDLSQSVIHFEPDDQWGLEEHADGALTRLAGEHWLGSQFQPDPGNGVSDALLSRAAS
jgi:hypothetical protein